MKKSLRRKILLAKAKRQNKSIPQFVIIRTGNRSKRNPKTRHWRARKLKLKVK